MMAENNFDSQENLINNVKYLDCERSLKKLINKYQGMLNVIENESIGTFKNLPVELDDIRNILNQKFVEVINAFDETRGSNFASYAKIYTQYRFKTQLRKLMTRNHQILNYCSDQIRENSINSQQTQTTDSIYEELEEIIEKTALTPTEEVIVREYELGSKSISELSLMLNTTEKNLYYQKDKAIKKLAKTAQSII